MRRNIHTFLRTLLFCIISFCTKFTAQVTQTNFQIYDADNGLPSNTVNQTFQDSYGFIWIGTSDGLTKFDGYKYYNYFPSLTDSNCIKGNHLFSFYELNRNEIWIAHNKGISVYYQDKNCFKNIFVYESAFDNVNLLLGLEGQKYLWVLLNQKGLVRINTTNNQIEKPIKIPLPQFYQNNIYRVPAGLLLKNKIYMSVLGQNIYYDLNKKRFLKFFTDSTQLRGFSLYNDTTLIMLGQNVLLIGNEKSIKQFETKKLNKTDIKLVQFNCYQKKSDSTCLIGGNIGLIEASNQNFDFKNQFFTVSASENEKRLYISHLYKDYFGNEWISCNGAGLIKMPYTSKKIEKYPLLANGNMVKAIAVNNNFIISGYYNNGMNIFNRRTKKNNHIQIKNKINSKLPFDNTVYAMCFIDSNQVFISMGLNNNSVIYNLKTKTFEELFDKICKLNPPNFQNNSLYKFAIQLKDSSILFSQNNCLLQYHYSSKSLGLFDTIPNETITSGFEDKKRNIWIGTTRFLYIKQNKTKTRVKINLPIETTIKSIGEDGQNNIWIATTNGIFVISSELKIIQHYGLNNGLVNSYVYSILSDKDNNIWFSHNKGISCFKQKVFKHYSVEDGLQGNEFNTNAYFKSKGGELFFGGNNGINSFYPQNMKDNMLQSTCRISQILVDDLPYQPDSSIWLKKKLILSPDENTISFNFFGNDFKNPRKTEFSYRLIGYEKMWIQNQNNNFVRYPNLPPGNYQLQFKCTNGDGIWQQKETTLTIIVLPYWYQTLWFKFFLVILMLALFGMIFYLVIRNREKKQIQKMEEMQRLNDERSRISRDLHDNVGSMVSFVSTKIDWILKNKNLNSETSNDLLQVKTNAGDIMLGLRETLWTLNNKNLSNADLADKLKNYFKSHLLIPFEIEDSILEEQIIPNETVLCIYRCCQEIVNNTNKHSEAKKVQIKLTSSEKIKFEIIFFDDGKGISESDLQKEEHYGLSNIYARLAEVEAQIEIESASGKGTRVRIYINSAKAL